MQIQCPSCRTQAELPASKAGAKVRCSNCEKVYVARARGAARGNRADDKNTKIALAVGGVVLVGAAALVMSRSKDTEEVAAAPPPKPRVQEPAQPEVVADTMDWDSPAVAVARSLHTAAHDLNDAAALAAFDAPAAWEHAQVDAEEPRAWTILSREEQTAFRLERIEDLLRGEAAELVADWEPYDGWVEDVTGDRAVVRTKVTSRSDPSAADRHVEWLLVRAARSKPWKAYAWTRWKSESEQEVEERANRPQKPKVEMVELSDGSRVMESEMRPIDFPADMPVADQERVRGLVSELTDIDARPAVRLDANRALVEMGKPAIPGLLTYLAENPLNDDDQAIRLHQVNLCLQEITGFVTSYEPHAVLGGTAERQESGLLQWFGWYDANFKLFKGLAPVPDPLLDIEPRSEAEERLLEKARREAEGG